MITWASFTWYKVLTYVMLMHQHANIWKIFTTGRSGHQFFATDFQMEYVPTQTDQKTKKKSGQPGG